MGGGGTVPSSRAEGFEGCPSWAGLGSVIAERFDSELTNGSTFASPTYWTLRPEAADLALRGTNPRTLAGACRYDDGARPTWPWRVLRVYRELRSYTMSVSVMR